MHADWVAHMKKYQPRMDAYIEKWGDFDDGVNDYDPNDPNLQNSNNLEVPVLDREYNPKRDASQIPKDVKETQAQAQEKAIPKAEEQKEVLKE